MKLTFLLLMILFCPKLLANSALATTQILTEYTSFTQHGDHGFVVDLLPADPSAKHTLEVELGCAAQGCSDWDYTVRFEWHQGTKRYELGRLITPYAGYMQRGMHGFDRNWRRTFSFDVSHLAPVLTGEGSLKVHYGGWGAKKSAFGIAAKLVSQPNYHTRAVKRVIPLYESGSEGWPYKTAQDFAALLPAKNVAFEAGEQSAEIKMIVTAHGHALSYDNPEGKAELCGEWCDRYFTLHQDGNLVIQQNLWRDDCDQSATFPQGGTYLFARANWCPGEAVTPFSYPVDISNVNSEFDLNWQAYSWAPSQYGKDAPRYIVNAVLVTYGEQTVEEDIALTTIVKPNAAMPDRIGLSCGEIEVEVANQGNTKINELWFDYGVEGQQANQYYWQGEIAAGDKKRITFGAEFLGIFNTEQAKLNVTVRSTDDQKIANNSQTVRFNRPIAIESSAVLRLLTGKQGDETRVSLFDRTQSTVKHWDEFTDASWHDLPLDVPVGCYTLKIQDSAHDGLAFPFFNQRKGKGEIVLHHSDAADSAITVLQPDFGRELAIPVTVGYEMGGCAATAWQADLAYNKKGQQVAYKGVIYQARHWSYNFEPDRAGPYDPWQAVSYCDGSAL
ncbi:peptide-N-glycosidase F-related protein [Pseudoalteromonas luteoviolacea]|uniref:Chitin-binding type-3 domain-containing protein n=1 Tax=Pseudoalteromonas luteoviolacea H33 TaxID=1365251 RepID=A0A167DT94_9GAMM|nr:peptide-N-glycosidase F-related protein [Pseudoalteromonas luteoviolacea]KZN49319.1 hypothetical protein N476_19920 [Pseudoalteromonas luteoviolacea H33]KZN74878.1 hypothetical protein N477_20870 [Pseudoalteromonas luteoviolacea H33-S]